ncbi:unnamed protein product, partial [Hymenolepis diminuta]
HVKHLQVSEEAKRNAIYQDFGHKSRVLRRGCQFMWTKTTQKNRLMDGKGLLKKLERSAFGFSPTKTTSTRIKKSILEMTGDWLTLTLTPLKFRLLCTRSSGNSDGFRCC